MSRAHKPRPESKINLRNLYPGYAYRPERIEAWLTVSDDPSLVTLMYINPNIPSKYFSKLKSGREFLMGDAVYVPKENYVTKKNDQDRRVIIYERTFVPEEEPLSRDELKKRLLARGNNDNGTQAGA